MRSVVTGQSLRRLLLFGAALALGTASSQAEAAIAPSLSRLEGYQIEPAAESREPGLTLPPGTVPAALLEEYILTSYSRWKITREGGASSSIPPLDLEVYEMLDTLGAFGLYSIWPDLENSPPGERMDLSVDNRYAGGKLAFWRGNFFFQVSSGAGDPERLLALAKALVNELDLLNLHPLTVIQLPKEDLDFDTIRYFLGPDSFELSRNFPSFLTRHLGLDKDIEITEARYGREGYPLFLVGYPTPALAHAYYLELQDALKSYFSSEGVYLTRAGVVVGVFFGPEQQAQAVLRKVQYTPTIKWLHGGEADLPQELRSLTPGSVVLMVKRSLIFILVFLGISLSGGLAAGMVRYGTVRRFSARLAENNLVFIDLDHS